MSEHQNETSQESTVIGELLFKYRDYTPIPLVLILLLIAKPSAFGAALGTILIIVGELIRMYSVGFIGSISRTRTDSLSDTLVTTGAFSIIRNPIYFGNFFIAIGFALFSGYLWFIILTIIFFFFQYYFIIKYEEFLLENKFGDQYIAYKSSVPCIFPKDLKLLNLEFPQLSLTEILRSERSTLIGILVLWLILLIK